MFNKIRYFMYAEGTGSGEGAGSEGEPAVPETPPEPTPWHRAEGLGLSDELIGMIENKGWGGDDGIGKMTTSYRELERHMGVKPEDILRRPADDDPDGFNNIMNQLGRPEESTGYGAEFGEGVQVNKEYLEGYREAAHKAGLTDRQFMEIANFSNEFVSNQQQSDGAIIDAQNELEMSELKTKWGAKFDERMQLAQSAGEAFGFTDEEFASVQQQIGPGRMSELFANMGDTMGEDSIAAKTNRPGFGTSLEQVKADLADFHHEIANNPDRLARLTEQSSESFFGMKGEDWHKRENLYAQLRTMQGG